MSRDDVGLVVGDRTYWGVWTARVRDVPDETLVELRLVNQKLDVLIGLMTGGPGST